MLYVLSIYASKIPTGLWGHGCEQQNKSPRLKKNRWTGGETMSKKNISKSFLAHPPVEKGGFNEFIKETSRIGLHTPI